MTPAGTPEVLCMGEAMALIVPTDGRLSSARSAEIGVAGAESTVARYLADLGHPVGWLSRVGQDPLGELVVDTVASSGVGVDLVERDQDAPTGVFFKDPGPSSTRVYYYRGGSAASRLGPLDVARIDWDGIRVVHVSGVTPALSASCADATSALLERGRSAGAICSFDVNYRQGLWSTSEAAAPLLELARMSDVVFVGLDEAGTLWGTGSPADVRALIGDGPSVVVKDGDVGATLFEAEATMFVPAREVAVVEAVGAGDAFAAGYLSALLRGAPPAERLERGHDLAAFALGSLGDHSDASEFRLPERRSPGNDRYGRRNGDG